MAENFIFTMQDLRVIRSGREILKGIYLSFFPGAKIGVIGPNGAGKSTLLRIMAGVEKEFFGHARPDPSARVGYLPQEPQLDASLTVKGNVELGVKPVRELLDRFNAVSAKFSEPMADAEMEKLLAEQAKLQDAIDAANGWELDRTLEVAMDALRMPPGDAEVATLSGGEKRRVALCKVLLEKPDLLLLDEPTNHLDAESVEWLEQHLKAFAGTVVAITHDRYFLDNVAQWILELDRGEGVPWKGNYSSWLDQKQKRLEVEEKAESARQKQLQHELEWIRMSPRARQAKGKARLTAYEELLAAAPEKRQGPGEIYIPPGPKLGGLVVDAKRVRKAYGERLLIDDLTFKLPPGHRRSDWPQRSRQDHAVSDDLGRRKARRGRAANRRHCEARLRGSESRVAPGGQNCLRRGQRWLGSDHAGAANPELARLSGELQFQRSGSAKARQGSFRRRTKSGALGEGPQAGGQRHLAGRADQ